MELQTHKWINFSDDELRNLVEGLLRLKPKHHTTRKNIVEWEKQLKEREAQVEKREQEIKQREKELTEREESLGYKETALNQWADLLQKAKESN